MPWSNSQFAGELTIPTGATTGARITINHNNDGAIKVYDASNVLIAEISATADVIKTLSATGAYAKLDPSAPSGIAFTPGPGLALGGMSGDVEPGSLTEFDDTFTRGLYLRTPSPVADPFASEGEDYAALQMTGRFHGNDPKIVLVADGPASFISINGTIFDRNGQAISYGIQNTYTPVLGNDGTATYSSRRGWWYRLGPLVIFNAYFVVNAAGSGAGNLTLTAPVNLDRVNRQSTFCHTEGLTAGNNGSIEAVAFTSGAGTTFDRVRNSTGANLTGADLLANGILDFNGWILEAV